MKKKLIAVFAAFFVLGMLMFSTVSGAYIDPSTMTFIVQIVAGVAVACGAAFTFYFRKIKRKLKGAGEETADNVQTLDNSKDGFDDSEFDEDDE